MSASTAVEGLVDKLQGWGNAFIVLLPNIGVALLVLLMFGLLARLSAAGVRRSLQGVRTSEALVKLAATSARIAVTLVGLFIALGVLKLDGTVASLLAGVGVIGLALGFAFQDIAANFMAGVMLAIHKPFGVGDMVETNGFFGSVQEIALRSTMLRTFTGQIVTLPNKDVFNNAITNYNAANEWRLEIPVGVSYGDDLDKVERVAIEAIEGIDERDPEKPIQMWLTGFGSSSIDFSLRFWVRLPNQDFLQARHDAIKAVKKAFDANGITIPFPIRTLDFAAVGGTTIGEAWPQAGASDGKARRATSQ